MNWKNINKYQINNCGLQYNTLSGGLKGIQKNFEYLLKFDCKNKGNNIIIEEVDSDEDGTLYEIYTMINNIKCGLNMTKKDQIKKKGCLKKNEMIGKWTCNGKSSKFRIIQNIGGLYRIFTQNWKSLTGKCWNSFSEIGINTNDVFGKFSDEENAIELTLIRVLPNYLKNIIITGNIISFKSSVYNKFIEIKKNGFVTSTEKYLDNEPPIKAEWIGAKFAVIRINETNICLKNIEYNRFLEKNDKNIDGYNEPLKTSSPTTSIKKNENNLFTIIDLGNNTIGLKTIDNKFVKILANGNVVQSNNKDNEAKFYIIKNKNEYYNFEKNIDIDINSKIATNDFLIVENFKNINAYNSFIPFNI